MFTCWWCHFKFTPLNSISNVVWTDVLIRKWNLLSEESADVLVVRQLQWVQDQDARPAVDQEETLCLDKDRTTWQNRFIWRWLTSLPPCPCDSPAEGTPAETNTDTWTSYHKENKHKTPAECWEVWRHMYRWLLWSRGRFSCSSLWSTWDTRRKHPEISALQYKTSRKEIIQKENGLQIFSLLKFLYRQR